MWMELEPKLSVKVRLVVVLLGPLWDKDRVVPVIWLWTHPRMAKMTRTNKKWTLLSQQLLSKKL